MWNIWFVKMFKGWILLLSRFMGVSTFPNVPPPSLSSLFLPLKYYLLVSCESFCTEGVSDGVFLIFESWENSSQL